MADDYLTLTEFIPDTKAKAQEVNANFSALKDAIAAKASINGDSTQKFKISDATEDSHAINKGQLDNLSVNLVSQINKMTTKFCVKSGHTINGEGDLFSYDVLRITPKIGVQAFECTPMEVKQVLTGYGRADKKEVEQMVKIALDCQTLPCLDDTVDAMAIAICHTRANCDRLISVN